MVSKLTSFDYEPLAAASIGQVYHAVTKDGLDIAMKIQDPGIADNIDSDIDNVKLILDYTNMLPEQMERVLVDGPRAGKHIQAGVKKVYYHFTSQMS
ncbi:hypothetical protein AgCh_022195 [Apium graveolens]